MSIAYTAITIEDENVPLRKRAQILREGMRMIAQNHRLVTMGKHFKNNAETAPGGAYGYVPRREKYNLMKQRKLGTVDPNVLTGGLMRATRNNSIVTATQYKSALQIKAPATWGAMNDQRRKELEAITPQEVTASRDLGFQYVRGEFFKPANQLKRKKRVT